MSTHKGPQIIRYCVINPTAALVEIVVGLIPQFKVNKTKNFYVLNINRLKTLIGDSLLAKRFKKSLFIMRKGMSLITAGVFK
tara:strand:- start:464 stop:709 length:246 start_codon:yes stop_codon:yes gene_type:complete